jgi:hypothetical protein
MNTFISKAIAWIKANLIISVLIGIVVLFMISGTKLKRMFGTRRRTVHHRTVRTLSAPRRRRSRKPIPRSVGMRKSRGSAKKKPWQIKGSLAARRHMAQIRARR